MSWKIIKNAHRAEEDGKVWWKGEASDLFEGLDWDIYVIYSGLGLSVGFSTHSACQHVLDTMWLDPWLFGQGLECVKSS